MTRSVIEPRNLQADPDKAARSDPQRAPWEAAQQYCRAWLAAQKPEAVKDFVMVVDCSLGLGFFVGRPMERDPIMQPLRYRDALNGWGSR